MKQLKTLTFGYIMAISFVTLQSFAAEAANAKEAAIAKTSDDVGLKWGPAPAFMPQGTELTVLHGDPAKKNADTFFRVPPKAIIPSHWHTSAERMILVAGELHVTYEGQDKIILKPGNYAYGPAKLRHEAYCASEISCVLFIAFEAPVDAFPVSKATK